MKKGIGIFLAVLLNSLVFAQQIELNSESNDVVLIANANSIFEVFSGIQSIESSLMLIQLRGFLQNLFFLWIRPF